MLFFPILMFRNAIAILRKERFLYHIR
ncbi:MAG: hypothetical protein COW10_07230 [Candidatus Omnitrophica bacterium CG12_big_fil_rev_8_21_14_0_65_42_8]|nr:MAG: hypothetical protein COW10_07230 [Candidatus Omnitrophica bacterium CG12_big_fil_rev_8_21_14_0_65_42_8]